MSLQNHFKTTTKDYKRFIFTYGILSVLYVIEYYEFDEEYEECQKIIDAIREIETTLDTTIFTTITAEAVKEVIESYKQFNMSGENVIGKSKMYCTLIIKEIESKFK